MASKFPKLPHRRSLSDAEANAINRLVEPTNKRLGLNGRDRRMAEPDITTLSKVFHHTSGKVVDANNIVQVLPQLNLIKKILISSIISPDDLTSRGVNYTTNTKLLESSLTSALIGYIQDFFDNEYKINNIHYTALEEIMFISGAYARLILPESTIDYAINGDTESVSMESLISIKENYGIKDGWMKPIGYLGKINKNKINDEKKSVTSTFESYISSYSEYKDNNNLYTKSDYTVSLESLKDKTFKFIVKEGTKEAPLIKEMSSKINWQNFGKVFVTDNHNLLKLPILNEKLRSNKIANKLATCNTAFESYRDRHSSLEDVQKRFYRKRSFKNTPMLTLLTPNQLGVKPSSHPIDMVVPTESIVPIIQPGDPTKKVGFLVLIDPLDGSFIKASNRNDYYDTIRSSFINSDQTSSQLIEMAKVSMNGFGGMSQKVIDELSHLHGQAVERDVLERLKVGLVSGHYSLSRTDEIDKIMFQRSCAGKNTTVLFIPAELMIYMAFNHNEYGVGKSLLEDTMVLSALMATLLFADIHGAVRNATGTRKINITLPEDDEEPDIAVNFLLGEYQRLNAGSVLAPSFNPVDIIDSLQNAGLTVSVKNSPSFPEVEFDIESREGSHKTIPPELHDRLEERLYNGWGITRDVLTSHTDADFATQVVQNKFMLLNRVLSDQEKYNPFITQLVRLYSINSGVILEDLSEIIRENKKSIKKELQDTLKDKKDLKKEIDEDKLIAAVLDEFINTLEVKLPTPITKKITEQTQELTDYSAFIDLVLPFVLTEEMFDSTRAGSLFDSVTSAKVIIKARMMRDYMAKHNIAPELMIFNRSVETKDSPASEIMKEMEEYTNGILKVMEGYMNASNNDAVSRRKRLKKTDDILSKIDDEEEEGDVDPATDTSQNDGNLDSGEDDGTDTDLSTDEDGGNQSATDSATTDTDDTQNKETKNDQDENQSSDLPPFPKA